MFSCRTIHTNGIIGITTVGLASYEYKTQYLNTPTITTPKNTIFQSVKDNNAKDNDLQNT